MRLTCPNCSATYDISQELIPSEGRDVQCSNCGHVWLTKITLAKTEPATISKMASAPDKTPLEDLVAQEDAPRPKLDPSVADILRAEAAHNRTQRANSSQNKPKNDEIAPPPREHKPPQAPKSRMDLLPDIGTISNSLLSPDAEQPTTKSRFKLGFWSGFWGVIAIAACASGVYVLAPDIIAHSPEPLGSQVQDYADWVDTQRLRLDLGLASLMASAHSPKP